MEGTFTVTPANVEAREVTLKKNTPEARVVTIYDVEMADGIKWTAWEREVAEAAWELRGQPVTIDGEIRQNGKYENRSIRSILPAQATAPTSPFSPPELRDFPTHPQTTSNTGFPTAPTLTETDRQIHRQVAAKVSAQISSTPHEFWGNLDELERYFATGQKPEGNPTAPADERPSFPSDAGDIPFE